MQHQSKSVMAKLSLEGECNKCGQCCSFIANGERVYCEHLARYDELGKENATACKVWHSKWNDMPIRIINAKGEHVSNAKCQVGSEHETRIIFARGIGKGCSLTVRFAIE